MWWAISGSWRSMSYSSIIPADLGDMGKGGLAVCRFVPSFNSTVKGGNATGYGNGGGGALIARNSGTDAGDAIPGNGSPGIIIIYTI